MRRCAVQRNYPTPCSAKPSSPRSSPSQTLPRSRPSGPRTRTCSERRFLGASAGSSRARTSTTRRRARIAREGLVTTKAASSCRGASLQCGKKLPSGKTPLQRLGIEPPKQRATPAETRQRRSETPEPGRVRARQRKQCHSRRARPREDSGPGGPRAEALVVNDERGVQQAVRRWSATASWCLSTHLQQTSRPSRGRRAVAAKRRLAAARRAGGREAGMLSLQKALPANPATALYARRLNTNEQAALQAISAKVPKAKGVSGTQPRRRPAAPPRSRGGTRTLPTKTSRVSA